MLAGAAWLAALGALALPATAQAQEADEVLLSNLGQSSSGGINISSAIAFAQGFTTGSNASGYHLGSIELDVFAVPNTPADVTIALWSATSDSKPDALVATLTHSSGTWATGLNIFNAPAGTELDANTMYFVHVSYSGQNPSPEITDTESTSADADGAADWSVGDRFRSISGGEWVDTPGYRSKLRINGRAVGGTADMSIPPGLEVTLVSNIGQGNTTTREFSVPYAQRFTTGPYEYGYTLSTVDVVSRDAEGTSFEAKVCTVDGDDHPTSTCTELAAPGSFAAGTITFYAPSAPSNIVLEPGTTYTVVLTPDIAADPIVTYGITTSNGEDAGKADGWSIADMFDYKFLGDPWETNPSNRKFRIAIKGSQAPEPETTENRPSEIKAYWRDVDTDTDDENIQGSNEQSGCASTERFRAYWNPPKSNGSFKRADEWEAQITPDPEYGASNVSFTIQDTGGNPREPELTGTVDIDGFSTVSIRVRGRFGNAWGAWSPRTGLYCWSSSSEERALVTMLAAEGARSVTEGTEVKFTLKRELHTTKEVMVKVSVTERGEMIQAGSYQPPEEVTFTAGDKTATLRVLTEDDDQQESDGAVIATLQPGPDYRLGQSSTRTAQVTVTDDEGGGPPGGPGDTARPPSAPRNLEAVGGDRQVTLSWEAPEDDGGSAITDYEYRIDGKGDWISTGSTDTTHTVSGLVNGTEYVFEVRAVNRIGGSRASDRAEVTPEAPEVLDFAHFANGTGIASDLVFVNLDSHPIQPAIYFYDTEGAPVSADSVVDVTGDLEIAEDGALTVQREMDPLGELTISTHGQGELVSGSVKVLSDGPIGGLVRFSLPGIGVAGVGASPPVRDVLFPARRQEGGIRTAAALHNLGAEAVGVRCRLMSGGVALEEAEIPLAANGQTSWFIEDTFTTTDTSAFLGSVRCTAPGRGRFTASAVEMDAAQRIFNTVSVVPVDRTGGRRGETVLDFAHFVNGTWITDLVFVNLETQPSGPAPTPFHTAIPPSRPVIYFYDTEGNLIDPALLVDITGDLEITEDGALTVQTEMEPLGVLTISTHGQGELVSGSVRVVSDGPIGGMLRFEHPALGVAGVGASPPVSDALFPVRRQEGGITTGVALHNLESSPGLVRCDLMREGVLLDAASIPLEANGQTAWLIDQAFPSADTSDFAGSVRCDAVGEGLFSAVALEMDPGNRIFTTLPVVPVPEMPDRE